MLLLCMRCRNVFHGFPLCLHWHWSPISPFSVRFSFMDSHHTALDTLPQIAIKTNQEESCTLSFFSFSAASPPQADPTPLPPTAVSFPRGIQLTPRSHLSLIQNTHLSLVFSFSLLPATAALTPPAAPTLVFSLASHVRCAADDSPHWWLLQPIQP